MEYKLSPISSIFNLWSVEWGPQNGAHGISKIQQGRFENMSVQVAARGENIRSTQIIESGDGPGHPTIQQVCLPYSPKASRGLR